MFMSTYRSSLLSLDILVVQLSLKLLVSLTFACMLYVSVTCMLYVSVFRMLYVLSLAYSMCLSLTCSMCLSLACSMCLSLACSMFCHSNALCVWHLHAQFVCHSHACSMQRAEQLRMFTVCLEWNLDGNWTRGPLDWLCPTTNAGRVRVTHVSLTCCEAQLDCGLVSHIRLLCSQLR